MRKLSTLDILNICVALSKEKSTEQLYKLLLKICMEITNCDLGIIYIKNKRELEFSTMLSRVQITKKTYDYVEKVFSQVLIRKVPFCDNVLAYKKPENIKDVYLSKQYDFSEIKKYDERYSYKTQSVLLVPMEDNEGRSIGVLQLVNATSKNGQIIEFAPEYETIILSIATHAAICQTNTSYSCEIQQLLDSMARAMSTTIDSLTPYNANHTQNMVRYCQNFLAWLSKQKNIWNISPSEERQIIMSILLHDAGKISVPLSIMDKDTRLGEKLNTVLDRFRIVNLLYENMYLKKELNKEQYLAKKQEIEDARDFVLYINQAGVLPEECFERVLNLSKITFKNEDGTKKPLLEPDEAECLSVRNGTLTDAERSVMEGHVVMTNKMLGEIRFPSSYANVRSWAAKHHEMLNGSGYPNGLTASQIPAQVRLITVLDVFDALTARDRPYKHAMSLQNAISVLNKMRDDGKIDGEILALFVQSKAWEI